MNRVITIGVVIFAVYYLFLRKKDAGVPPLPSGGTKSYPEGVNTRIEDSKNNVWILDSTGKIVEYYKK